MVSEMGRAFGVSFRREKSDKSTYVTVGGYRLTVIKLSFDEKMADLRKLSFLFSTS
jgi:hypothetical protein